MSLVQGYSSSSDSETNTEEAKSLAPDNNSEAQTNPIDTKEIFTGHIQAIAIDSSIFKSRINDVGDTTKRRKAASLKKKRKLKGDPGDLGYLGPWAGYESSNDKNQNITNEVESSDSDSDEQLEVVDIEKQEPSSSLISKKYESTGRSILDVPKHLHINITGRSGSHECFVPKRVISKFDGHSKGINKIEYFPSTGHIFLTCSNDTEIKLWSFYDEFELVRIYSGHTQGVTDIRFNNDGTRFLSCSYDKEVHLWETETGKVIISWKLNSIPNGVQFNPNNENEFIVGLLNNKIEHYDITSPDSTIPTQIYDHHLGSITSLSVIEHGKRFLSCSSDKSIKIWDWGINIPVKIISDPAQPYIPVSRLHPNHNYISLQCMDDTIKVIQGHGKYKFNKKKIFKGHHVSGYKIDIDISPDGKILLSGDSKGFGYFWDWNSCRLVNKLKLSEKTINCVKFHPQESSKVLMGCSTGQIICCD